MHKCQSLITAMKVQSQNHAFVTSSKCMPTHVMNYLSQFHWKPSTKHRDVTSCKAGGNGRTDNRETRCLLLPTVSGGGIKNTDNTLCHVILSNSWTLHIIKQIYLCERDNYTLSVFVHDTSSSTSCSNSLSKFTAESPASSTDLSTCWMDLAVTLLSCPPLCFMLPSAAVITQHKRLLWQKMTFYAQQLITSAKEVMNYRAFVSSRGWSVEFVCLFVCSCPNGRNSRAIFIKPHTQVGTGPRKNWLVLEESGSKVNQHIGQS